MAKNPTLTNRLDLGFIGDGRANAVFQGKLLAHAFPDQTDANSWLEKFSNTLDNAIGSQNYPVYRMADGEYRFLMGRKFDWYKRPRLRELAGFLFTVFCRNRSWKTSWGETYDSKEYRTLRKKLIEDITTIAKSGFLALYLYDNGLHAFENYNAVIPRFLSRNEIELTPKNYVPFHFPVEYIIRGCKTGLFHNRRVLVVSSLPTDKASLATYSLKEVGAKSITHVTISATRAMKDRINLPSTMPAIDICLVAAGIGSAALIPQLKFVCGPVIDIGGFVNCLVDPTSVSHSVFSLRPMQR
jgi:hypothetical protein